MSVRMWLFVVLVLAGSQQVNGESTTSFAQKVYWSDYGNHAEKIQRANTDGTGVEDILTGIDYCLGIAIHTGDPNPANHKLYWTSADTFGHGIFRSNLDGTNVEPLITGWFWPTGLALDLAHDKMYWTDYVLGKIQRAHLDGSNIEDLVTPDLDDPYAIALDTSAGKMYWSGFYKIQRANLDGTDVEDVFVEEDVYGTSSFISGLALDLSDPNPSNHQIYWTNEISSFDGKIQRANLNGANAEDLVSISSYPRSIALDTLNGKMYWGNQMAAMIQRANLDGSGVENVISTGGSVVAVTLYNVPVPEPSTLVGLLSMGLIVALRYVWRRRRRAA